MFEYLDLTLSPAIQASVREHLGHCQACRKAFEEEQKLSGSLSAMMGHLTRSLQAPSGLQEKALSRIRQSHKPPIIQRIWPAMRWAMAAAACLLIVSITAFLIRQLPPSGTPGAAPMPAISPSIASVPMKQAAPVSARQTREHGQSEPPQNPLAAKRAKPQFQSAADPQAAMAEIKARRIERFAKIESVKQEAFQAMAGRRADAKKSAAALEAAMAEIKARRMERVAGIESEKQEVFQAMAGRRAGANKSAAVLEAAMATIKARQENCFSRIKATQQSLTEKILAARKSVEES